MDIIGKWKVKQLNIPTLDGVIQCTPDNMPEGEIFEEFAPMANAIFEFTPEGSLDMLLSFSAEELEDAAKHGERVRDGYFVAESKPWKEVDGKFYYLEDQARKCKEMHHMGYHCYRSCRYQQRA